MFDSHCHLDFEPIASRRHSLLSAAHDAGVRGWLVPGCDPNDWLELRALKEEAESQPWLVEFAVGLHPWWGSEQMTPSELARKLNVNARSLGAVAIGEIGLDKNRGPGVTTQVPLFEAQLEVARDLNLPVIFHLVGRHAEFFEVLRRVGLPHAGGVMHGFGGGVDLAQAAVKRGLKLGVGRQLLRSGRLRLREAVCAVGLEDLLVETDAPEQRRDTAETTGELTELVAVCAALGELRGESQQRVMTSTERTACSLFGVQLP